MKKKAGYQCEKASIKGESRQNPNEDICQVLCASDSEIPSSYIALMSDCSATSQSLRSQRYDLCFDCTVASQVLTMGIGDHWRTVGLQKAVGHLRNMDHRITGYAEAKQLPTVGDSTARKVGPSARDLQRLAEFCIRLKRFSRLAN